MNFGNSLKYAVMGSIACGAVTVILSFIYFLVLTFVLPTISSSSNMGWLITALPIGGVVIIFFGSLFGFTGFIAWVLSLLEVITSKRKKGKKALWVLGIFFLSIVGVIIYYVVGRKAKYLKD